MTATNSERSFNEALARVLWTKHPSWRETLAAEQHGAVKGGGMPDLIVRNPLGAPVVSVRQKTRNRLILRVAFRISSGEER